MRTLSINDTNVLKGIAVLLLLCHHCFYPGEPYDDIILFGHPVVQNIGEFSKLCVAIFVFLSGYGLTAKTMKDGGIGNLWKFYRYRYMKLMLNFWAVYILFVPVGVLFFHRTFSDVYGCNWLLKAIVDFWGIHFIVVGSPYGYNATWWFFSCIILLYAIYPLLWKLRDWWMILIPCSIMLPTILFWNDGLSTCVTYLLAFICGQLLALFGQKEMKVEGNLVPVLLFLFLIMGSIYRFYSCNVGKWDAGLVLIMVGFYSSISLPQIISDCFAYLGKHSYNVFMFHTFILSYYCHDYIYWSRFPIIIYTSLLLVCILLSLLIELIKRSLKFDRLLKLAAG